MRFVLVAVFALFAGFTGAVFAAHDDVLVITLGGSVSGEVAVELYPDVAPQHVKRIKQLATTGAYDGVVFHRVINQFMAQTGDVQFGKLDSFDPNKAGTGGSQYDNVPAEFSKKKFRRGVLGMARSQDPNSANSQFFIMFNAAPHLNNQYTVVGKVISGMEFVDKIKRGQGANGAVGDAPDYMETVRIKGHDVQ